MPKNHKRYMRDYMRRKRAEGKWIRWRTAKKEKSENWLDEYADAAINRVLDPKSHSWQDDFVKSLIKKVLKDPAKFKKI